MNARNFLATFGLALVASFNAQAATTHFCDCGGRSAVACVPGLDTNSGATTLAGITGPKRTVAAFQAALAVAVPGDRLLFCRGGGWDNFRNGTIIPRNGTIAQYTANPLDLTSFAPTQFSSSARPALNPQVNLGTLTVTAVSKAAAAVVTANNTLVPGDLVYFGSIAGMPEITGVLGSVTAANATSFTINIDTSVFATAGTSGNAFIGCGYNDTAGTCGAFNFYPTGGTAGVAYGGFDIHGFDIHGGDGYTTGAVGVFSRGSAIRVFDNTLSHLDGAMGCSNGSGGGLNGSPTNIKFYNNSVSYILGNGASFFGCNNVVIENNTWDRTANGAKTNSGKIRDHALYVSGNENLVANDPIDTSGVVIRNNVFTNTGLNQIAGDGFTADALRCNSAIIVGHARIRDWLVELNQFLQAAGTDSGFCYGLSISPANYSGPLYPEYEINYTVRANLFVNTGNIGINTQACQGCTIENNVLVRDEAWDGFTAISVTQMGNGGNGTPVANNANVNIRNNSVFMLGSTGSGENYCVSLGGSGTGHSVTNNLCMYGAVGPGTLGHCFDMPLASSAYTAWNNNHCFNFAQWARVGGATFYATKAAFTAAFPGLDANSVSADPLLVAVPSAGNSYSMAIQVTSPARAAGHNTTARKAPRDKTTCARPAPPSIGAYEYFAAACGTKPTGTATRVR